MIRSVIGIAGTCFFCATMAPGIELEVVEAVCREDAPFPQFMHLWSEGWTLQNKDGDPLAYGRGAMPLGAYVHVYLRNASDGPLEIEDVLLEGVSLAQAIAFSKELKVSGMSPASIHFSKLTKDRIDRLVTAGEPVWWKAESWTSPAGGLMEVTIRLRRPPGPGALQVEVVAGRERVMTRVACGGPESPRLSGIGFSESLNEFVVHARHPKKAVRPASVRVDGKDLTRLSRISFDPDLDTAVAVIRPDHPPDRGSFHLFEVIYADRSVARAGQRAFADEFVYGMWGYINRGETVRDRIDYYLGDMQRHNVNALMQSYGNDVASWLDGDEGLAYRRKKGLGVMSGAPGQMREPLCLFLTDEPDAHDYEVKPLEATKRLGSLAQSLVQRGREWRGRSPETPQLLNVDNTFKPENWYMYGQLADVYCADPYYQEQQRIVWNERPAWVASFVKPTYVLGVTTICQSACAPRPLHIILNCVRHDTPKGPFRFATPAEKRLEVFYALAAGAKGLSYWWYTPYGEFHGCGSSDPAGVALWREIGLLGALARTAGPLIAQSCPATLPVKSPARIGVRSLLSGDDVLVLLVMNEGIASDRQGTVVVPVERASITIRPPAWMETKDAFEISERGVGEVAWHRDGRQTTIELGRLEVARMVVLTADTELRQKLGRRYTEQFAERAAKLVQ